MLYSRDRLGLGEVGFGLITTVGALGGLVGTAAYGWLERHLGLAMIMRVGLVIETLTHLVLALTTWAWLALVVFFVFGVHAFVLGHHFHERAAARGADGDAGTRGQRLHARRDGRHGGRGRDRRTAGEPLGRSPRRSGSPSWAPR